MKYKNLFPDAIFEMSLNSKYVAGLFRQKH